MTNKFMTVGIRSSTQGGLLQAVVAAHLQDDKWVWTETFRIPVKGGTYDEYGYLINGKWYWDRITAQTFANHTKDYRQHWWEFWKIDPSFKAPDTYTISGTIPKDLRDALEAGGWNELARIAMKLRWVEDV